MKKKANRLFMRIRPHKKTNWVSCWIIERDAGGVMQGRMHGCLLYDSAAKLAAKLGIPIEVEKAHWRLRKSERKEMRALYKKELENGMVSPNNG